MGLEIYNLSHTFTQFMPEWPSTPSVNISVKKFHAKDGVYQVEWEGIMHRCTHMDAPIHVTECTPSINDYPLWRLFGTGVAVSIPKGKWGVITPEDLENARPKIEEGDIVMINTGFHHKWADTDEYFGYGPGHQRAGSPVAGRQEGEAGRATAARPTTTRSRPSWSTTVSARRTPTSSTSTRPRPAVIAKEDFPKWEPAHKTLMVKGGIPGIENVGGDLDKVTGKRCTFMAFPGAGRVETAASCACSPSSIPSRSSASRPGR